MMYAKLLTLSWPASQISHWSLYFSLPPLLSFFLWMTPAQWIRTTHRYIAAFPFCWENVQFFLLLLIGLASMLSQISPLFLRRSPPRLGFLVSGSGRQSSPPSENISTHNVFISGWISSSLGMIHLWWLSHFMKSLTEPKKKLSWQRLLPLVFTLRLFRSKLSPSQESPFRKSIPPPTPFSPIIPSVIRQSRGSPS